MSPLKMAAMQAAGLIRQAADILSGSGRNGSATPPATAAAESATLATITASSAVKAEVERGFAPYQYARRPRGGRARQPVLSSGPHHYQLTWSHRMFCLSSSSQVCLELEILIYN